MYIVGNDSGMREAMKVIDLTHILEPGMPVYPGTEPPAFAPGSTYERDGFKETCLTLFGHVHRGTGLYRPFGFNMGTDVNNFRMFSDDDIMFLMKQKRDWWDNDPDINCN